MLEALITKIDGGGVPALCATLLIALALILRELRARRRAGEKAVVKVAPAVTFDARPSRPSWPMRRVLIVEDAPLVAKLYELVVSELEHVEVEVVGSSEEALARVQSTAFDLLIVDVGLPGMSGAELVRLLRERSMRPLVRVVIASGMQAEALAEIARACGASAWLRKPIGNAELLEVATRLLDRAMPVE